MLPLVSRLAATEFVVAGADPASAGPSRPTWPSCLPRGGQRLRATCWRRLGT